MLCYFGLALIEKPGCLGIRRKHRLQTFYLNVTVDSRIWSGLEWKQRPGGGNWILLVTDLMQQLWPPECIGDRKRKSESMGAERLWGHSGMWRVPLGSVSPRCPVSILIPEARWHLWTVWFWVFIYLFIFPSASCLSRFLLLGSGHLDSGHCGLSQNDKADLISLCGH